MSWVEKNQKNNNELGGRGQLFMTQEYMTSFNFITVFSNVPQGSILAIWDMRYLFQQYGIDFFSGIFRSDIDKCSMLDICLKS